MKDWTDAHDDTDVHIARISGFVAILHEVTMEWPALNNPDPVANGILSLIRAIKEDVIRLEELHSEEWRLVKQIPAEKAA